MANQFKYSKAQVADVVALRKQGLEREQIAARFSSKYKVKRTANAVRCMHDRWADMYEMEDAEMSIRHLQDISRAGRRASKSARENKVILDYLNERDDVLSELRTLTKELAKVKIPTVVLPSAGPLSKRMTLEFMVSDIHLGKKTKEFDLVICERRMVQYTEAAIKKISMYAQSFTITNLMVALLGDMINSYTMHGLESAKECEFGNARQVREISNILFTKVLVPLAQFRIPMTVVGICGNHDRTDLKRTYVNPGEDNLTYIIYHYLKDLCDVAGFDFINFIIPACPYAVVNVYGNNILYEHGDNLKGRTSEALDALVAKRQTQLGLILHGSRMGHFHYPTVFGRGDHILNGSVCGDDSFADVLGLTRHNSQASQMIVSYIETSSRPTCFYEAFPVYLD